MAVSDRPEIAVGGLVVSAGHLLLIERGRPPAVGQWSVPGGRVERGETLSEAVVRELREETGLETTCGALVGWVERISGANHFVIMDFLAELPAAQELPPLTAGDDAAKAAWVPLETVDQLPLVDGLAEFLHTHGFLPAD